MTDIDIIDQYDEEGGTEEFRDTYQPIGPNDLYVEPRVMFTRDIGSDQFTFMTQEVPVNFGPSYSQYRPILLTPRFESGIAHKLTLFATDVSAGNPYLFRDPSDYFVTVGASPYCPHGYCLSADVPLQLITSAPLYVSAINSTSSANPCLISVAIETFYGRA